MFIWTDSLFPGFALASSKFFRIGLHHGFRMDFYGFEGSGLGFFSDLALVQVFFRIGCWSFRIWSFGFSRIRISVFFGIGCWFFGSGSFSFADTKMLKFGGDRKLIRPR